MPRIDLNDDQFARIQDQAANINRWEHDLPWYSAAETKAAINLSIQHSQATIGMIALAALKDTWSPGTDGSITEASGPPAGRHG